MVLERIRASLSSLAPAEQRVAKLVLADPIAFANQAISVLAELANVSKPTIVRFCRSMGYAGLSDFKLKLAGSASEGVPYIHRSVTSSDKPTELFIKVVDNALAAFLRYRSSASAKPIEAAIEALCQAPHIEFFGVGNSGIVAQDAQHKFFRLGLYSIAYSDGHIQLMSVTMLKKGDCLVIISNSGQTRDLIEAASVAKKKGATIIAITSSGTQLAKIADIHLAADHPEGYDQYSPMVSRLLHLLIIDVLATGVALKMGGENLQPKLKEMKLLLRQKRES